MSIGATMRKALPGLSIRDVLRVAKRERPGWAGRALLTVNAGSATHRARSKSQRASTGRSWAPSTAAIATVFACAAWGVGESSHSAQNAAGPKREADKLLTRDEAANLVRQKLKSYRAGAERDGRHVPPVFVSQGEDNVIKFQFVFPKHFQLVTTLVKIFENLSLVTNGEGEPNIIEFHSATKTKDSKSLSFAFKDGSGSLLLREQVPSNGNTEFNYFRDNAVTEKEVDAVVEAYMTCFEPLDDLSPEKRRKFDAYMDKMMGADNKTGEEGIPKHIIASDPVKALENLGVEVYQHRVEDEESNLDWDSLAGYDGVKRDIEDTIILALRHPEVYERIAKATRKRFETNRPRAVLFEGPPGTGKTLTAKIIACRADIPMVHLPVEKVLSKWYSESERKLSQVFDACDSLGGAIIFIDEVDAMATSRDNDTHEATRRMLSVLLQRLEGFESNQKNILVCATNRKGSLDTALLSRFSLSIRFTLPDLDTRKMIFERYAQQLAPNELEMLAAASERFSARDIKDTCQDAERRWASKVIREGASSDTPPVGEYLRGIDDRAKGREMGSVMSA